MDLDLDKVRTFINTAEEKGYMTRSVAKQTRAGLEKIAKISAADEHQVDVGEPSKVDKYFKRYLNKYPGELSTESAKVYSSRVKKGVENCVSFYSDPMKYSPTFGGTRKTSSTPQTKRKNKFSEEPKDQRPSSKSDSLVETFDTVYPLRAEYMLPLSLPKDLKSDEVRRFAYYLLTLCRDFNPGKTTNIWSHQGPEETTQLAKR